MDAELTRRDQNLEHALKQRDEAWREKLDRRDNELLKIMKEREDVMEKNMLKKANAFGYLYKEYHKEIKLLIENRDKEIEAILTTGKNYGQRAWIWSITI